MENTIPLEWPLYPNMVCIKVLADGSCFFHALCRACYMAYILEKFDRRKIVMNLRRNLAKRLGKNSNKLDPTSPLVYDMLSRGNLRKIAKDLPQYSLENMQNELLKGGSIDYIFHEFISNELEKDIYILDATKRDVYIIGNEDDILYKDRPSIVLLYNRNHYDLVGIRMKEQIHTLFSYDDPFIQTIRDRLNRAREPTRY